MLMEQVTHMQTTTIKSRIFRLVVLVAPAAVLIAAAPAGR
jgi:hypothetical protein